MKFDDDRRNQDADGLDEVAKNVDESCPDVQVMPVRMPVIGGRLVGVARASAVRVGVAGAVKEDAEDDVEDDGATGDDHHRVGLDLEVVGHDAMNGEVEQDASHVPDLEENLRL